ncbi:MAG: hypothetical protein IIZ92_10145 [Aquincola sp.]|nr:hypothetical protein [Aquincola sp.]
MTTNRYIAIDSNTGYVWGTADANNIVDAARLIDEGIGNERREYAEHSAAPRDSSGYYVMYRATGSRVEVTDGQDPEQIAAVKRLPIEGFVSRQPVSEDAAETYEHDADVRPVY